MRITKKILALADELVRRGYDELDLDNAELEIRLKRRKSRQILRECFHPMQFVFADKIPNMNTRHWEIVRRERFPHATPPSYAHVDYATPDIAAIGTPGSAERLEALARHYAMNTERSAFTLADDDMTENLLAYLDRVYSSAVAQYVHELEEIQDSPPQV
jgi:hypothetical protein